MRDENFSPEDSLRLIESMIHKTQQGIFENSRYFLLWGWCVFAACLGQFLLKSVFQYTYHFMVWLIMIPCLLVFFYWIRGNKKSGKGKTYVNETMGYLWSGMGIAYLVLYLIFMKLGFQNCYPFYILLYGLGTFVSGRILQFRFFIWGGLASLTLAAISIWFDFDYQALFAAAAVFISYILPGYLFRNRYKTQN